SERPFFPAPRPMAAERVSAPSGTGGISNPRPVAADFAARAPRAFRQCLSPRRISRHGNCSCAGLESRSSFHFFLVAGGVGTAASLFAHRERGVLPQNYEHGLPHLRLALLCFTAGAMAPPGAGGRLSVHPSAENPLNMRASQD